MSSFVKYWLPPLFWASLVSMFSSDSFSSGNTSPLFLPLFHWLLPYAKPELIQSFHYLFRKLGHFTEFFVLAMLLYRALRKGRGIHWQWRVAGWTLSLVLMYAIADEVHQRFVPSRSGGLERQSAGLLRGLLRSGSAVFAISYQDGRIDACSGF